MRNKTRFQYVDEFRKINCLEKLHPIQNLHPDDEEDAKQDNNKFIRYKEQILLQEQPRSEDYLYNEIINGYKVDIEEDCNKYFNEKNTNISNDIEYFKKWSESLNHEIKARDYKHKFYFKDANPPPRLKEDQTGKDKSSTARSANEEIINGRSESAHEDTNLQLPQKGKYNFHEITKHLYMNNGDQEDKDSTFLRDMTIKSEISELRKLKNLQQIERIGEFNDEFNKFSYYIESLQEQTGIEYIDNSIVRGNNTLTIDYFRDIGTPSRRILEHTINKESKMKFKEEEEGLDMQNDYQQQNRELLYLYFLKEEELKINKSEMTFFDMANMAMGRITSNNAHMCVRNEKVTKAQYTKLLKKMEKYDIRENEAGKPKVDKEVGTEELEEMNVHSKGGEQESEIKEDKTNIEKVIDQINKIRKEVKLLEEKGSVNKFNRSNFNNEIYIKLEKLLNLLYDMITDKMGQKYSLSEIGQHLHEIQGTNELGYDRLRILWFVANCYDEMLNKQEKTIDLRSIGSKQNTTPQVIKYKGNKLIAQETIQTKKVYGFNVKDDPKKKENNRSKSPINVSNRTPVKSNINKSTVNRTPTKYSGNTGSKVNPSQQNTAKKYPYTAKK